MNHLPEILFAGAIIVVAIGCVVALDRRNRTTLQSGGPKETEDGYPVKDQAWTETDAESADVHIETLSLFQLSSRRDALIARRELARQRKRAHRKFDADIEAVEARMKAFGWVKS